MYASAYGVVASALHLLDYNAQWMARDERNGRTFIHYVIARNNNTFISELIEGLRERQWPHLSGFLDDCLVFFMLKVGRSKIWPSSILKTLLDAGANPNTILFDTSMHTSMLHFLENGVEGHQHLDAGFHHFHIKDGDGVAPLSSTITLLTSSLTLRLLQSGCFTNDRDHLGRTALHHLLSALPESMRWRHWSKIKAN